MMPIERSKPYRFDTLEDYSDEFKKYDDKLEELFEKQYNAMIYGRNKELSKLDIVQAELERAKEDLRIDRDIALGIRKPTFGRDDKQVELSSKSGEVEPPKVNTAYGSRPDDFADTGLVEPPKVNTAYGSRADDYADTGLVEPPKANMAYGSGYGESTPYDIVSPEKQDGVYVTEEGYDERIEELEKELWHMENFSMKLEREFNGKEDKNDVIRYDFYQDERMPEVKTEIQRLEENRTASKEVDHYSENAYMNETDAAIVFAQPADAATKSDGLERVAMIVTMEVPVLKAQGQIVIEKRSMLQETLVGEQYNVIEALVTSYLETAPSLLATDATISFIHTHPGVNSFSGVEGENIWDILIGGVDSLINGTDFASYLGDRQVPWLPGVDKMYLVSPTTNQIYAIDENGPIMDPNDPTKYKEITTY